MKFDSILRSNHDLKKNGYQIIRKLHKMECKEGANRAYSAQLGRTYYFVLGCVALVDIIKKEYPDAAVFATKCDSFLSYLDSAAKTKSTLSKSIIGSFLRSYTSFFNRVEAEKKPFAFDQQILELWNIKCLMAYIATWSNNR